MSGDPDTQGAWRAGPSARSGAMSVHRSLPSARSVAM